MRDGDYHDIWIAFAFAVVVAVLGKLFLPEGEISAWIMLLLIFGGGPVIMQRIADRERRKHGGGD